VRSICTNVTSPLSIKWMPVGWSNWRTARTDYRIEGERFLILNHGSAYSLSREGGEPQESFCPFFAADFVEDVHAVLITDEADLLDRGADPRAAPLEFREQLYDDGAVLAQLRRMRMVMHGMDAGELAAAFHELAERLLRSRRDVQRAIERLPGRRMATRSELHRRLQRGREYLHAHFTRPVRLADMARAACLAPHYFHRLFSAAFGCPPHAYVTKLRLERAAGLLVRTELPITDVCFAVGFDSVGSFSALFRRHTGVTPTAFRKAGALECGSLLPLWSARACSRFGVGGVRWSEQRSHPVPRPPQSGSKLPHSKAAASRRTPKEASSRTKLARFEKRDRGTLW